jgi:transcriptional regulator with XRE-family HTH domain
VEAHLEPGRCVECGRELLGVEPGADSPSRCEDCVPETGPGSRLFDQLTVNMRLLRASAGVSREELAARAAISVNDIGQAEGDGGREPGATRALRLAHSLGTSIDQLAERIYWNPGETASSPGDRRPAAERLSGFFLVLPANVPVFDPPPPHDPIASRQEAAQIFGQNLRGARERRHLTQATLACAAGLSKAGLSLIERGIRETTIETALSLARSLQVTPEFLFGGIAWAPRRSPCESPRSGGAQRHRAHSLDPPIGKLWREGKTAGEIAAAVGASSGAVSAIVHRLREHGEDLPYRSPERRAVHEAARRRRERCPRLRSPGEEPVADAEGVADTASRGKASDEDIADRIGANLALHRRAMGLTLRELGEAVEVDRSYLHQVENGKRLPRLGFIVKLAASLNVRCERVTSGITWEPGSRAFRVGAMEIETDTALSRLGQNVLGARRRVGISQQCLGAGASMSRGDVVDFERGNRNFRIVAAVRLAGALRLDFAELFSGVVDWYVRPLPPPEYGPGDRRPTKAERDAVLVRMWREGRAEEEIGEALDLKASAVGPYVRELRDAGHHLPYRRPARSAAEIAARRRRAHSNQPAQP